MPAAAILQAYLDEISVAVMTGDFAAYRAGVVLPFHLVTHTENLTFTTDDDLREGFESFCAMLRSQRVTDYIRLVESAQALDPNLITGRYISHIISGGMRVFDPFPSQTTLRRIEDRWKAASISNAVAKARWPLLGASPAKPDLQKGPEE
ncbi:hypothetical protein [Pseudotabrizicola alkalilacus]|uniref:Uncharacterized protein n=1 Tax=Pseudotabrizicola alkalilacus TaxID=2305252 RepID=A0A411Z7M9_9RHOB|nr:hypothetical protein [Pseudotabrizicola alkalilacus]RGP39061.1 hypothetical protein D1012_02820 [Pseudotabrizicola alkalilacus]